MYLNIEITQNSLIHILDMIKPLFKCSQCEKINDNYQLCKVGQHKYKVNNNDSYISIFLRGGIYWEKWMHHYFNKYQNKNACCLDIGANLGTHTVVLADKFKKVYAFEPQNEVFKQLDYNCKINNCNNVTRYNVGLGNKAEIRKISCFDRKKSNNIGAMYIVDETEEEGCETIRIKTLDSFNIKEKIDLIKIDVEGFEYFALSGGIKTIKKNKPVILIEEHNYANSKVFKLLMDLGYKIRRITVFNDFIAEI